MEQSVKPAKNMEASLMGSAGSISIAIMISRVLGLVRDIIQARYFGAGLYTDALTIAQRVPNLLRDLFAEGALSAAFVPTFIRRLTQDGKEQAWQLANRVISVRSLVVKRLTSLSCRTWITPRT